MSKKRQLKFVHIDFWSRPLFTDNQGFYFGSLNDLFPDGASFEDVTNGINGHSKVTEEDIVYFGREIDGDPDGTPMKPDRIELVKEFYDK